MRSINDEVKHDLYISSNIVLVRTPINENDTVDNINQNLPYENEN